MKTEWDLSKINFGYACISNIIKNCSTASRVPLNKFKKIKEREARIYRLERVAKSNLKNTIRLLWHNVAEDIKLYRFSSQLVPLGNHPISNIWNYTEKLSEEFNKIGRIVKENELRVSTHPGQYTVINAREKNKFENAMRDLLYHDRVLTGMNLDENAVMVVHVGGVYGNKEKSIERFIINFKLLPKSVQQRIVIENDDSAYSIKDVLSICKKLECPMVLDVHHHECYNQGENLSEYITDIFATWEKVDRPPKIHFSSPRSKKRPRSHADYIDVKDFINFLDLAGDFKFDVMIEAKKQDKALLKLREELNKYSK